MTTQSDTSPDSRPKDVRRAGSNAMQRRLTMFVLVLILCAIGVLILGAARREHRSLRLLCNQVERAAAPGEVVLVDQWWLNRALNRMGSPALQKQLLMVRQGRMPGSLSRNRQEMIYVGPADGPLAKTLRDEGFVLTEASWNGAARHSGLQIYFVR